MKKTITLASILALLCILSVGSLYAQQKQNPEAVKKLQQKYNSYNSKHEVTFDQFLKANNRAVAATATGFYLGCTNLNTICGNGDFESGLDTSEYQGAYGTWGSGDPDPSTLTSGFISGDISDFNAHQTIVSTGIDPNVGITTTNHFDTSSKQALRLGNDINLYGTELISKNIKVTSAQTIIPFYYAVVFEDPQHAYLDQPAFSVRVFDCATGQELTGVCDLGNGSNKAVSDRTNPFFQCSVNLGCNVIYRDWTRSEIDLSAYIGKTVNIQFLNKDCGLGGHYGYTYLDDIGGCNSVVVTGPFGLIPNTSKTDSCGTGQICADYILPKAQGTLGQAIIDLNIYQNGSFVKTISSDTLRTDSSTYCFSINPYTLGIDTSLPGFDYTLKGNFFIAGQSLTPQTVGNPPDGQEIGQNNDYSISPCKTTNNAPFFVYPPTPADSITLNTNVGQPITFTVKAKDNDAGDKVTLTAANVPTGAVIMPALPKTGNPVSVKFMWTPGAGDVGTYPVHFIATDKSGSTSITTVIVQVSTTTCDSSFRPFIYAYPAVTVANQEYHTIYKGYGAQNVTLTAIPRGGSGKYGKYKFMWDNGSTLPIRIVSPSVTTKYMIDITDGKGCVGHTFITIHVVDVRCGNSNNKVKVCFGSQSLCVDESAVAALIKGGAKLGDCNMTSSIASAASATAASTAAIKVQPTGAFTVYPNPARNTLNLKWNIAVANDAKINILDLQGRVLISQVAANAAQTIDISKLSGGVYMAQLSSGGRQLAISRFTVSK